LEGAALIVPLRVADNSGVILIPIVLVAWFAVLVFAVALCRAAAQADRGTDSLRAAPAARAFPREPALAVAASREASSPVGKMPFPGLAH
jgi:hypothetical protein